MLSISCGKPQVKGRFVKRLAMLGEAIDRGNQPYVFNGGFIDLNEPIESEVNDYATPSQPRTRSEARSRKGRRSAARQRPPGKAEPFRSVAVEDSYGAGFRVLVQHYEAISFEDNDGLWVAVKSRPLGLCGPRAHFLIALPTDQRIAPRAWAFSRIGPAATAYPLKHTNFPDASICAFTKESGAWSVEDGLTALVDHYSLWALKSLHWSEIGWWPGPQIGVCALYRRNEFVGREWCGCESGKRYSQCHQFLDHQVTESEAQLEFKRFFRTDYSSRRVPYDVMVSSESRWKQFPTMRSVFALRASDEPMIHG